MTDQAGIQAGESSAIAALDKDTILLERRVRDYFDLVPAAVIANLFNTGILVTIFTGSVPRVLSASWAFAMVALALFRYNSWLKFRRRGVVGAWNRALRAIDATALGIGSLWGMAIGYLVVVGSSEQVAVLGVLGGGMMGGAVQTYGAMPRAAKLYIGAVTVGAVVGFMVRGGLESAAMLGLLISYAFILDRSIVSAFDNFRARTMGELDLVESGETVKMLLNDYESQSADWLWEVGKDGILSPVSDRFAEVAQRPREVLSGTSLLDLFVPSPEAEMLRDHIENARPFRDLTLAVEVGAERFWWTLSARPFGDKLRGVATDVSLAKRAEAKVSYMAHYDGLTDLANRFLFNESLQRALKRRGPSECVAVLYLDLDNFKTINDTLGHHVGDQLLRAIGQRLEEAVHDSDLVARLGGDEFAILMPGLATPEEAHRLASQIVEVVADPIEVDGHYVLTTTSIGVAVAGPEPIDAADLLQQSDLALYSAKAGGRNRAAMFEIGMDDAARDRRQLEMDMRGALSRSEFELHYQPLINVATGKVVSYEALIRWVHPQRGTVMPSDFIPIAEDTGMIVQLGEWVIHQAVAEVARWAEHLRVSVNLSPAQMRSAGLISTILNALAAAGIAPDRLELEITESVLMHDTDVNLATLHRLRELGIRISLDDFGTGYSSLNYLRSFPFDKIKIDRCFVDEVDSRSDCQAIVRAVTGLATSLGMITTAEGVERTDQLARLELEGCTEVQGFLFSKAVRPEELTDLRRRPAMMPASAGGTIAPIHRAAPKTGTTGADDDEQRANG